MTIRCILLAVLTGAALPLLAETNGVDEAKASAPRPMRPQPAVAPPAAEIDRAIELGIAFLLNDQNKDGSWGSAHRTKDLNIYAPVPGAHQAFRAAVTSLCLSALIETGDGPVDAAISRGEQWLIENLPHVRRAEPMAIYNTWTHGYAIQALVRMLHRLPGDKKRVKKLTKLMKLQVELLGRYESIDGGWGYYDFRARTQRPSSDSTSFLTATILVALYEARAAGIEIPETLVQRAVASIQRQRKPDFTYLYGEYLKWRPMMEINRPAGSLGRSQVCNLALRLWGEKAITDQALKGRLDWLFARNDWLSMGRKRPIPHESWFMVAGYFYYYGHYYAALCIEQLPPDDRRFYQDHLAAVLRPLQESDGSWWDYPLYNYHQQYGTAFALMSLKRCR